MQVKKQEVNVGKAVFEGEIKSVTDGSIIVPDVKPDILKILQVDADTILEEKTIDNGKLILRGKVNVNVLYIPEFENGRVECIKGCFEFCETVKRAEFESNMYVVAFCDAKKVGYKLINSRKIGLEAYVGINICVTQKECISYISEIEGENCQFQKEELCVKDLGENSEFTFKLDETVDLNCEGVAEILKSNVTIIEKEYRALTGKIVLKGKARVSVLYVTEDKKYGHFEFEVPFTEVFDSDNIEEECECEVLCEIIENEIRLIDSTDESKKSISAYVKVQVFVSHADCVKTEYIKDCYFTDAECLADYAEVECEEVIDKPNVSTILKYVLEKNEKSPDISEVYTTVAKPYITAVDSQNGHIAVSGKVVVYVLYLSNDSQCPLASITEEIPFNHMIECENVSRENDVLLNVECEHISYTLSGGNNVEIRCGLGLKGRVIKKSKVKVMSEISVSDSDIKDKSLVIYFVKKGDTIWNIGKNYHVKCQDICRCNNLTDEELAPGQKIIIPITK